MIILFQSYSVHFIDYNLTSAFHFRFSLEINKFFFNFVLSVGSRQELPQHSILNTYSFLVFFRFVLRSFQPWADIQPSSPARCQPSSSPPPLSGSVAAAWSLLSSRSMTAPTPFCALAPTHSPSESGHGTRSSTSATSRPARQWTLSLGACDTTADRRVRAQAALPQPSGSRFQTCWFLHLPLWCCDKTVQEPFSYPARRFLHARDRRGLYSLHRRGTRPVNGHCQRGWTADLFSFQPRPELRGSPVESCLCPWGR